MFRSTRPHSSSASTAVWRRSAMSTQRRKDGLQSRLSGNADIGLTRVAPLSILSFDEAHSASIDCLASERAVVVGTADAAVALMNGDRWIFPPARRCAATVKIEQDVRQAGSKPKMLMLSKWKPSPTSPAAACTASINPSTGSCTRASRNPGGKPACSSATSASIDSSVILSGPRRRSPSHGAVAAHRQVTSWAARLRYPGASDPA